MERCARDIGFLLELAASHDRPAHLFQGVRASNECQKNWLREQLADLPVGSTVAVLGLTYKPGTDTLRRSGSVELCRWLLARGMTVHAHDPAIKNASAELVGIAVADSVETALCDADVSVLATPWPEYRALTPSLLRRAMRKPCVIDPTHFLAGSLAHDATIRYIAAGRAA